jgi:hypothetical protein
MHGAGPEQRLPEAADARQHRTKRICARGGGGEASSQPIGAEEVTAGRNRQLKPIGAAGRKQEREQLTSITQAAGVAQGAVGTSKGEKTF